MCHNRLYILAAQMNVIDDYWTMACRMNREIETHKTNYLLLLNDEQTAAQANKIYNLR